MDDLIPRLDGWRVWTRPRQFKTRAYDLNHCSLLVLCLLILEGGRDSKISP